MKWQGTTIRLEDLGTLAQSKVLINGEEQTFPADILGEIKLALLDGIDIGKYIRPCLSNPYRLQQVRVSLMQSVPSAVLQVRYGNVIRAIRQRHLAGLNIVSSLMDSNPDFSCPEEYFLLFLKWFDSGVSFPLPFDFWATRYETLQTLSVLVRNGDLDVATTLSTQEINLQQLEEYTKLSELGAPLDEILSKHLKDVQVLGILAGVWSKSAQIGRELLGNLKGNHTAEYVNLLVRACQHGLPVSSGVQYTQQQLSVVVRAQESGLPITSLKPSMTPYALLQEIQRIKEETSKVVQITL